MKQTEIQSERRLDPEVAPRLEPRPVALQLDEIADFRAGQSWPAVPERETVEQFDRCVPADPEVTVRVFRPRGDSRARGDTGLPCIFWVHGGGMITGSYTSADVRLQGWVEQFDCVAVAVKYRFAPEHPYPAALDDCYAALAWIHENAAELGVDPGRVGVAGYSAGATLAAALALLARDRGDFPVAFQLLRQSMLDDRGVTRSSRWHVPPWYPGTNATAWRAYLGDLRDDDVPAYAAPARATDLSRLPPTFVQVGAADIFFDENVAYAQELVHAGVPTELHVYADAPHGFDLFAPDSRVARRATRDVDEWLARALAVAS